MRQVYTFFSLENFQNRLFTLYLTGYIIRAWFSPEVDDRLWFGYLSLSFTFLLCNNQVMAGLGARVTGSCMLFPDAL